MEQEQDEGTAQPRPARPGRVVSVRIIGRCQVPEEARRRRVDHKLAEPAEQQHRIEVAMNACARAGLSR